MAKKAWSVAKKAMVEGSVAKKAWFWQSKEMVECSVAKTAWRWRSTGDGGMVRSAEGVALAVQRNGGVVRGEEGMPPGCSEHKLLECLWVDGGFVHFGEDW